MEQIQDKVTRANQHLTHLENEVLAVQKRRKTLSSEIEAETARLVKERKQDLAQIEADAAARLVDIDDQIDRARATLTGLERQKISHTGEMVSAEADLKAVIGQRDGVLKQLQEASDSLEKQTRRELQLVARVQFLEGSISPLEDQLSDLKGEIEVFEQTKDAYTARNATMDSQYLARKDVIELEIGDLLAKQQELEVAQAGMLRQYNAMSEDIAVRTKVADEREEILKRREYKVAGDEKMVARNANLINL